MQLGIFIWKYLLKMDMNYQLLLNNICFDDANADSTHELILQSAAAARIISQLSSQPRSCPPNIYTIDIV